MPVDEKGALSCGPGKTQQHQADACNINNIMAQYENTGQIEHVTKSTPRYEDYSNVGDYLEAQTIVLAADESFMTLPAAARASFHNNAGEFLDFCETVEAGDPVALKRAVDIGLISTVEDELPPRETRPPVADPEPTN